MMAMGPCISLDPIQSTDDDSIYMDESELNRTVTLADDYRVTLTYKNGTCKQFDFQCYLTKFIDLNGNEAENYYASSSIPSIYFRISVTEYYNNNTIVKCK